MPRTPVHSDGLRYLRVGLNEGGQDPSFLGARAAVQDKDAKHACIGEDQASQMTPASECKGKAPPFSTAYSPWSVLHLESQTLEEGRPHL